MAATHEVLLLGDSEITGSLADVIQWKLTGEGFKAYEPAYTGVVPLAAAAITGGAINVPISIWKFGDLRFIQFERSQATLTGAAFTYAISADGVIPAEHRPKNVINCIGRASADTIVFICELDVNTAGHVGFSWCVDAFDATVIPDPGDVFYIEKLTAWYCVA